ncbi:hypothetical protein QAD02_011053 [Eretmocerus hayati]|uniref:Uncharacterized protein n=1 Tax=Eretmocerus hayati TaxID=131215 RepID=A0ACC2NYI6_9HYME|nr:hypothetical protein QAD02_011053 [Eretmocerus hayati]
MPSRDDNRSLSTEQRWIPPSTIRRDALAPENSNDVVFRKVRGILNKLTPEKFAKLSNDLLNLELNSNVILKGVIILIFEKALDEPKYSSMYAQLCKRLSEEAANFENNSQKQLIGGHGLRGGFGGIHQAEQNNKLQHNNSSSDNVFKRMLLNKCRIEFENRSKANEVFERREGELLSVEDEERRQSAKRKMLGNIKFIGELGKLEIVSNSILHKCIQQLMDKRSRRSWGDHAEDIECLCQIMRTCGRILDTEKGASLMEQYFKRMNVLAKNAELPLRIRFMLRDVIELRDDKWFGSGGGGGVGGGGRRNQSNAYSFNNQSNRHQNNFQGKHNQQQALNNNGNKEPVRFNKNKMLIGPTEEVSLRPSANSMTFKQPNINPNLPLNNGGIDLFPGRIPESPLMRASAMRRAASPPMLPTKETPAIVIKQGPLDKREKARERKEKGPTKEDVMKKVNAMMDDFITKAIIPDAIQAFKELKIPERFMRYALYTIYSNSLERNEEERNLAADLAAQMRKENVINATQYHDGWKELVNSMAEKESAVPCISSHVAQLTTRAIVDGLMHLSDLASVTENGQHYPLFLLTLQQLHKTQGKNTLTQIFNESKVNLIGQLPEAEKTKERLGEILEDRDLTFLYPLLRIQGDMWKQLEADPSPSSLFKWIKEKLDPSHHSDPGFINALVTVLLKYITQESTFPPGTSPSVLPDKALQEKEVALLKKYQLMLQNLLPTIESQVTAVHSLQVFCLSLNFPKGMLLRWFIALYDLSIVDEDAFMRWKEDVNDAYPGKGDALFQVNAWVAVFEKHLLFAIDSHYLQI